MLSLTDELQIYWKKTKGRVKNWLIHLGRIVSNPYAVKFTCEKDNEFIGLRGKGGVFG